MPDKIPPFKSIYVERHSSNILEIGRIKGAQLLNNCRLIVVIVYYHQLILT